MKTVKPPREPVTIERLERGLLIAARMLVRHGAVVMPIFERLEREIAAMKASEDAIGRAKKLLEAYKPSSQRAELEPMIAAGFGVTEQPRSNKNRNRSRRT